jgi:ribosome assembly protein YihI (activator of Der GTPase)
MWNINYPGKRRKNMAKPGAVKIDEEKLKKAKGQAKKAEMAAEKVIKFTEQLDDMIAKAEADGVITPEEQAEIDEKAAAIEKWMAQVPPEVQPV